MGGRGHSATSHLVALGVLLALTAAACSGSAVRHVAATLSSTPSALDDSDAPLPPGTSPLPGPTSVASLPSEPELTGPLVSTVNGLPPVVYRIETTLPIVFLTIDDGWVHDPQLPALFRSAHIPVTLFLTDEAIAGDYAYFRRLQSLGAVVEDHTLTHPDLPRMSLARQEHEICATADTFTTEFGSRPTLFRPPFGDYDLATLVAAESCRLGPFVLWDAAVNDGKLSYAQGAKLRPGDIILMHFRKTVRTDFAAAVEAIRAAGLRVAQLATYLQYDAPTTPVYLPQPTYTAPTRTRTWTSTAAATASPTRSATSSPTTPTRSASPTATTAPTTSLSPTSTPTTTPIPSLTTAPSP